MRIDAEVTVHEIPVLSERDDGSGGVVRVPLLPAGIEIDLARTAGGGKGKIRVTNRMLEEIAGNFGDWPMPVALAFPPHTDDRNGPQPAFVDSVSVDDGVLWGEIDAGAFLFSMLVRERAFRGSSVELRRDPKTATVELEGWVLVGAILTNQPATPSMFKIAASGEDDPDACSIRGFAAYQYRPDGHKGNDMSKDAAALEAKIEEQTTALSERDAKIADLETKLEAAKADKTKQDEQVTALQADLTRIGGDLTKLQASTDGQRVVKIIADAKARGIAPSVFEGSDDDPLAWVNKRFKSIDAFQAHLEAFPAATPTTVRSDNGRGPGGDAADALHAECLKLQREGKVKTYAEAMDFVRDTMPDVYSAGVATMKLERGRDDS